MTNSEQPPELEKVFVRYRKQLIFVLIFIGLVGFFSGEKKEVVEMETSFSGCLILQSYQIGETSRGAGYFISKSACESDYEKLKNPEKFLRKSFVDSKVNKRDFGAEAVSRVIRFFGFGLPSALVVAVLLALRARGDLKEIMKRVKEKQVNKIAAAKSKSESETISFLNRSQKQGNSFPTTLQRQANQYAKTMTVFISFLFVMIFFGTILIALSPEEQCESFGSGLGDYCEKDWFTSIVTAAVGFLMSSLLMLSLLTVAKYIQWRTSTAETD